MRNLIIALAILGGSLTLMLAVVGGLDLWEAWTEQRVAERAGPTPGLSDGETVDEPVETSVVMERCSYSHSPYRVGYFDHQLLTMGPSSALDDLIDGGSLGGVEDRLLFDASRLPWRLDSIAELSEQEFQVRLVELPCDLPVSKAIATVMSFRPDTGGLVYAQPNHLMSAAANPKSLKGDPTNSIAPIDPDGTPDPCCSESDAEAGMETQASNLQSDIESALGSTGTLAFETSKHSKVRVALFDSSPFPDQPPTPWNKDVDTVFQYQTGNIIETTSIPLQRSNHGLFSASIVKSMAGDSRDSLEIRLYQVLDDHADGRVSTLIEALDDMIRNPSSNSLSPPLSDTVVNLGLSVAWPSTGVEKGDANAISQEVAEFLNTGGAVPSSGWFNVCTWVVCAAGVPGTPAEPIDHNGISPSTTSASNALRLMVWLADQAGASIVAAAGNSANSAESQAGTVAAAQPAEWAEDNPLSAATVFTNVVSVAAKSAALKACYANRHDGNDTGTITGLDVFGGVDADQDMICDSSYISAQCEQYTSQQDKICTTAVIGRVYSANAAGIDLFAYWAGSSFSTAAVSGYIAKEKLNDEGS